MVKSLQYFSNADMEM